MSTSNTTWLQASRGKLTCIVGGQYGSEGKGPIASHIANDYNVHVRVGSPNAGHTFYWNNDKHVMQSIPCGWTNKDAKIVIGRGALINVKQLLKELSHVSEYYPDFKKRLFIDSCAGVLDEKFHQLEGGTLGEMHKRIGSTGEGVGPARIARIARDPENFRFFKDIAKDIGLEECMYENTPKLISEWNDSGDNVLIEGTQGCGLSLLHGKWPYVTSIDTNASQLLAEVGISPFRLTDVIVVFRTFPIRVFGNSGYMKNEITWDELSKRNGRDLIERTTVTHKVRRIAEWDNDLFDTAMLLNGPAKVALTFVDYIDKNLYNETNVDKIMRNKAFMDFVMENITSKGYGLSYIGTSERTVVDV